MKHENLPTNVQILMEARRLVAQGWVKGMPHAGDSVCLTYALSEASGEAHAFIEIASIVSNALGLPGWRLLPHWNDAPERTLDEVLGVLDEAILRETGARAPYELIDDHFFNELEKIGG